MAKIAERSGVSLSTVSLALRDRRGVDPDTPEQVREMARNCGYIPPKRTSPYTPALKNIRRHRPGQRRDIFPDFNARGQARDGRTGLADACRPDRASRVQPWENHRLSAPDRAGIGSGRLIGTWILDSQITAYDGDANTMAAIIRSALPDVPWEERPENCSDVVWRAARAPAIPRDLLLHSNNIINSAVVPYEDGGCGVFRVHNKVCA